MKRILLCSSSQLLIKGLYASLRDEGYEVDVVEHPSLAVQKVLKGQYALTVIDTDPFGLPAADAARIVGAIVPGMPVLCLGGDGGAATVPGGLPPVGVPEDLDAIREMIHRVAV